MLKKAKAKGPVPKGLDKIPWSKGDPEQLFTKTTVLDEGAFGVVWSGTLKKGGDDVAIKMMTVQEESLDEIKSEINFLKQFNSPFVIHYYGTWLSSDYEMIWIVLELAELGSLEGIVIFCEHSFSEAELSAIMARSLLGLSYVHSKGLVHQDIKAKNILMTAKGEVKLADFGVAASVTNVNQNRNTVSGSPHWMAPEILSGTEITQKCDIWSLGITLIELIETQPPYADISPIDVIAVIPEKPAPRLANEAQWSREIRSFLKRMCEKDPAQRRPADRLMKHPFVKSEVAKALRGDHDILSKLAEECYETVQMYRAEMAGEGEDTDEGASQDYDSESSYESSDDGGPLIIKGKPGKTKKKSAKSFASVEVDEQMFEEESLDEKRRLRSKLMRRKSRKTKAGGTRLTRSHQRNNSVMSLSYRQSQSFYPTNHKASMMIQKKQNLQFNLADVKTERFKNKQTRLEGNVSAKAEHERDDTIKKAEALLAKLQALTNRKQL